MKGIAAILAVAATGSLLITTALPAVSAPATAVEIVSTGALVQTAAKKGKKAKAAKSCGTYMYPDKKGKCVDARNKK
jgi:hypothetical protein